MLALSLNEAKNRVPKAFVSIGSNLNKTRYIPASLIALEQHFGALNVSSIYESEAVGFSGASFYNLVVSFNSELSITELAAQLRDIETAHGRIRTGEKFSAHTLDLDLLLYDDWQFNQDGLRIPRPDIERYAFVLEPLAEIAPHLHHPVSGISYATLWQTFDKTDVKQHRINTLASALPTKLKSSRSI